MQCKSNMVVPGKSGRFKIRVFLFWIKIRLIRPQHKQESPPAWTQEAYRPWHIKYYRRGVHPPFRVPPRPGLKGGVTQGGVPPCWVPPRPSPTGATQGGEPPRPGLMGRGVPMVGYPSRQGTPHWTWLGYPSRCGQTEGQTRVKT